MKIQEIIKVYDRKSNPVTLFRVSQNSYERLDDDGNPTGTLINLKTAFGVGAYFPRPKPKKKGDKRHV